MRVLVTGSTGLIGKVVCRRLDERGHDVAGFSLTRGMDIRDYTDLNFFRHVDGIIHLAAMARSSLANCTPSRCWQVNVLGTLNVLRWAAMINPRPWVINASTRDVYGHPLVLPATEQTPFQPAGHYARSKAAAEAACDAYIAEGVNVCTLRLSSVYGSPDDHRGRVAPAFALAAAAGDPITVRGNATALDMTHVDDVADAMVTCAERMGTGERLPTMLLASGRCMPLTTLATIASDAAGGKSDIWVVADPDGPGVFFGDSSLAREKIGWDPRVPVEEGMALLVAAYQEATP